MAWARRWLTVLGGVLFALAALTWPVGQLLQAPFGLSTLTVTALAAVTLAGALTIGGAALLAIATAVPQLSHALALRDKSWGAAFLPQRDPDAAGRPRPRAPSAVPVAALS